MFESDQTMPMDIEFLKTGNLIYAYYMHMQMNLGYTDQFFVCNYITFHPNDGGNQITCGRIFVLSEWL